MSLENDLTIQVLNDNYGQGRLNYSNYGQVHSSNQRGITIMARTEVDLFKGARLLLHQARGWLNTSILDRLLVGSRHSM